VNYQLLAKAAAENDSLTDPKLVDEAMWPVYTREKTTKWFQSMEGKFSPDTSNLEAKFNEGALVGAKHILFQSPQGQEATGSDSVRRKAEAVLKQTTAANFGAMAKQYGSDGTKDRGGDLGLFPKGAMVAEFDSAVRALRPGEIGPLVKTQYGYHIIRRSTWNEVKDNFSRQYVQIAKRQAESTFVANMDSAGKYEVKPNAAKAVKEMAASPEDHRDDETVIATSRAGELTVGRTLKWLKSFPQGDQIRMQLQQAPDSVIPVFVKNILRNEYFLYLADSAKVALDTAEVGNVRRSFTSLVGNSWAGLRVAPHMLGDSAKTPSERERVAAARVDDYLERLVMQQEQYVEIPPPLQDALRAKYDGKVNAAGLDRAVQAALKIRATADSARAAQQPKSAVPMPKAPEPKGDTARK
jgi:hypothetical protein